MKKLTRHLWSSALLNNDLTPLENAIFSRAGSRQNTSDNEEYACGRAYIEYVSATERHTCQFDTVTTTTVRTSYYTATKTIFIYQPQNCTKRGLYRAYLRHDHGDYKLQCLVPERVKSSVNTV